MKFTFLFFLLFAITGCQQAVPTLSPANEIQAGESLRTPVRKSFDLNEEQAVDFVKSLGKPWSALNQSQRNPDSFTGGFMEMIFSSEASSSVGTLPSGRVWNIQLRSGVGNHCGNAALIEAAIPAVVAKLIPTLALSDSQQKLLLSGLRSDSVEKVEIDKLHLTTRGGCIPSFDVRYVMDDQ